MWHFKSKLGTFWIVPGKRKKQYWLGVEDEHIGLYSDAAEAATDVHEHLTGHVVWDKTHEKAPHDLNEWAQGEPDNWDK